MEYVKDAIEKARHERQAKLGEESTATVEPPVVARPAKSGINDALNRGDREARIESLNKKALLDNRIVAAFENDERAEPYRQLRTQILKKFRETGWRTLAITSAHENSGKTLTAVNTAIALAKDVNQRVLLVDLDFKGPDVLQKLGLSTEAGLVECLQGKKRVHEVLIDPGIDRLTILPATPVSGVTSEILSSPEMKLALEEIVHGDDNRIIVFDLPPLLRDDDALVFAPYVDATLLVVESGVTTPHDLERCLHLLEGVHVLGTIFNKAD